MQSDRQQDRGRDSGTRSARGRAAGQDGQDTTGRGARGLRIERHFTRAGENPFEYLAALLDHAADVRQKPDQWLPWRYQATLDSFAVRSPPPP